MSLPLFVSGVLAIVLATAFLYIQYAYSFWKRLRVPFQKPSFPFGNFSASFMGKKSLGEDLREIYESTAEPVIGIYTIVKPALLIRDPKLIQHVLVKDFQHFINRGFHTNTDVDPLGDNILMQNGDKWRNARTKMSPTFTSGKLKSMFETIVRCGNTLEKYLDQLAETQKEIEVRDIFARFATNAIASIAFGIEVDCLENPDHDFRKYGKKFFDPTLKNMLRVNVSVMSPTISRLFGLRFADKDVGEFMTETVRKNLEYREQNGVVRKDLFQLLMQLRNTGKVQEDGDWNTKTARDKQMSVEEMTAQAYLIFIGGFESSSTTMSFCAYELAKNQEIQQRAYEDIVNALAKHDGQLTYESLNDMKYLEQCIDETLRIHPPFEAGARQCTKDYNLPDSDIIIKKGTTVMFSVTGLHYDPKYYKDPTKFIPERHDKAETAGKNFIDMPRLEFGDGPRNCLGLRLGKMQVKIAIVLLLQKLRFELADQHVGKELKMNPRSGVRTPIFGINLKLKKRSGTSISTDCLT